MESNFSHGNEVSEPGYYRVQLDTYHVLAELTATAHAGMHRYTFPASKESHIIIDLVHGVNNQVTAASLKIKKYKFNHRLALYDWLGKASDNLFCD